MKDYTGAKFQGSMITVEVSWAGVGVSPGCPVGRGGDMFVGVWVYLPPHLPARFPFPTNSFFSSGANAVEDGSSGNLK